MDWDDDPWIIHRAPRQVALVYAHYREMMTEDARVFDGLRLHNDHLMSDGSIITITNKRENQMAATKNIMIGFTEEELRTLKILCIGKGDLLDKITNQTDRKNNPILAAGRVQGYAEVLLNDVEESGRAPKLIRVEQEIGGISIHIPGYGDAATTDGYGTPILLEMRAGIPHILLWDDITDEEPSHVISLIGALEENRDPEEV